MKAAPLPPRTFHISANYTPRLVLLIAFPKGGFIFGLMGFVLRIERKA